MVAGAINAVFFKQDAPEAVATRELLHQLLRHPQSPSQLGTIYCGLRWVGVAESVRLVDERGCPEGWAGVEEEMRKAVARRASP